MHDEERVRIAYHEAGHALMAWFLGWRVVAIDIDAQPPRTEREMPIVPYLLTHDEIRIRMAGPLAETLAPSKPELDPTLDDWVYVFAAAVSLAKDMTPAEYAGLISVEVQAVIEQDLARFLPDVAAHLLQHRNVDAAEWEALMERLATFDLADDSATETT